MIRRIVGLVTLEFSTIAELIEYEKRKRIEDLSERMGQDYRK